MKRIFMGRIFAYLLAIWGLMISLRFINMYINQKLYQVNKLDVFFDLGILFVLSLFVFIEELYQFLKRKNWVNAKTGVTILVSFTIFIAIVVFVFINNNYNI